MFLVCSDFHGVYTKTRTIAQARNTAIRLFNDMKENIKLYGQPIVWIEGQPEIKMDGIDD